MLSMTVIDIVPIIQVEILPVHFVIIIMQALTVSSWSEMICDNGTGLNRLSAIAGAVGSMVALKWMRAKHRSINAIYGSVIDPDRLIGSRHRDTALCRSMYASQIDDLSLIPFDDRIDASLIVSRRLLLNSTGGVGEVAVVIPVYNRSKRDKQIRTSDQ